MEIAWPSNVMHLMLNLYRFLQISVLFSLRQQFSGFFFVGYRKMFPWVYKAVMAGLGISMLRYLIVHKYFIILIMNFICHSQGNSFLASCQQSLVGDALISRSQKKIVMMMHNGLEEGIFLNIYLLKFLKIIFISF